MRLLFCLWSPTAPGLCATCACVCWRRSWCVVALINLLMLPAPISPLAAAEVQGEGARPLWKTPVLPLSPATLNATVPHPSWHLSWDALNELKEIQWDTWCSSHGTPLLLCLYAQRCPPAQAQRRTHHGTKNTQSATVYQAELSSSPTTTLPQTHSPTSPLQMSDFSLLGRIPSDICLIVGMEEIANRAKERKVICVL